MGISKRLQGEIQNKRFPKRSEKGRGQWILQEVEVALAWMPNNPLRGTRPQEMAAEWI